MSDKTSDKRLLSCPFCGGEATIFKMKLGPHEYGYGGMCKNTPFCCSLVAIHKTKEEAIAAWNTRKPMERIVERLEEESRLAEEEKERLLKQNPIHFDIARGYANSLAVAIEIVKEEMFPT